MHACEVALIVSDSLYNDCIYTLMQFSHNRRKYCHYHFMKEETFKFVIL